jgi:hypothetical protein
MKKIAYKISLLCLTFLSGISIGFSQNAYTFFESYRPFEYNAAGKLEFQFDNANFFKNNEFDSKILNGYTLTGTWIRPKLVYYPDDKLRVELGGNVLKYNGREDYYNLQPWFSVQYQPTRNLTLIMGNLNNNQSHRMPESIREPELFLTAKPEAGFQAKYNDRVVTGDAWIDWQRMILQGDPFKEHFEFGLSSDFALYQTPQNRFSIPFFMTASHTGGEIDTQAGLARTFMSLTSGFCYRHSLNGKIFKGVGTNDFISLSTHPQDDTTFTKNGSGIYLTGFLSSKYGMLTASYWRSQNFYVPQGGYLFQNLSTNGNGLVPVNELVGLKYSFDKEIFPMTHFGFMLDLYYDTIYKKSMNSEGLYLIVNFGIPIKK